MKIKPLILSVFIISIVSVSINVLNCKGENMKVDLSELKAVSQEQWDSLANKKIYFGHQSVGYNIIDGIKDIIKEIPEIELNIVERKDANSFDYPIFAHSTVGKNREPLTKLNDFRNIIEKGVGDKVDYAFIKFCYIDIEQGTDLDGLFEHYLNTFSSLKKQYPNIKFIHFTIPLQQANSRFKVILKKLVGKPLVGEGKNIKRNIFNQKLVDKYSDKGMVFDLARFESTYTDGKRQFFKSGKQRYFSLVPEYTDDGGHLNVNGRKIIAGQLMKFLAVNTSLSN